MNNIQLHVPRLGRYQLLLRLVGAAALQQLSPPDRKKVDSLKPSQTGAPVECVKADYVSMLVLAHQASNFQGALAVVPDFSCGSGAYAEGRCKEFNLS
jgi:hypothetical protein